MTRSASLVLVLPTLPVTAAKRAAERARAARPRSQSAVIVSSTSSNAVWSATSAGTSLTIAATAPAAKALATKVWPSKLGPLRAMNRSPATTDRLSIDTPVAAKLQRAVLRVATAASASVHKTSFLAEWLLIAPRFPARQRHRAPLGCHRNRA